jgi:hypothetical protein
MMMFATPDGWTIKVVSIDGHDEYEVKHLGYIMGGGDRRVNYRGRHLTLDEVKALLGPSYVKLVELEERG